MTLEQCAAELGLSSKYLSKNFRKIQQKYQEKGIIILKKGRGVAASYGLIKNGESQAIW